MFRKKFEKIKENKKNEYVKKEVLDLFFTKCYIWYFPIEYNNENFLHKIREKLKSCSYSIEEEKDFIKVMVYTLPYKNIDVF